jgi:hypothetical protein
VLFTRTNEPAFEPNRGPEEREERLFALHLGSGVERDLGVTGRVESYLDATSLSDVGLLISTCHLQCRVSIVGGEDDGEEIRAARPIRGLDAEGSAIAVVWEDVDPGDPDQLRQELVVEQLDGERLASVRLPSLPFGDLTVDLSTDQRAAIVSITVYGEEGPSFFTLLVEGLGSSEPAIRYLDSLRAARYSLDGSLAEP